MNVRHSIFKYGSWVISEDLPQAHVVSGNARNLRSGFALPGQFLLANKLVPTSLKADDGQPEPGRI